MRGWRAELSWVCIYQYTPHSLMLRFCNACAAILSALVSCMRMVLRRKVRRYWCQCCWQHRPSSWQRCGLCGLWLGKGCSPEACWVKDAQCCRLCVQSLLLPSLPESVQVHIADFLELATKNTKTTSQRWDCTKNAMHGNRQRTAIR